MIIDMNAVRALAKRREDSYRAHFEDCADCPGSPDGECARAHELYRSWTEARELPVFRCPPGQGKPEAQP